MKYKVGDIVKLSTGEKGTITKAWGRYSATIGDDNYDEYNFDEKEIIGLWEGRKPKLKLIDILNKIANGELKEGTKFSYQDREGVYGDNEDCIYFRLKDLNETVELIEPQEPTDNTKIEELDKEEMLCLTLQCAIAVLTDKLNEVIRYINK